MSLTQDQQNRICEVVKDILLSRINCCPKLDIAIHNAPFHGMIIEYFKKKLGSLNIELPYMVAIANWLYELNYTAGTGFENISHILSGGYKRKFTGPYKLMVKRTQADQVENIIRDLKAGTYIPDLEHENNLIFNYYNGDPEVESLPFTADVYFERGEEIIAIELKSVRPNSGEGRGEKQKILYGKAALKLQNPNKNIKFFVGFPFDPTSIEAIGHDKQRFFNYLIEFKKFFSPDEVLIAGELWDFLSGQQGTMEEILNVITDTVSRVRG